MVGAENYYQYAEHYFRSMRSDLKGRKRLCCGPAGVGGKLGRSGQQNSHFTLSLTADSLPRLLSISYSTDWAFVERAQSGLLNRRNVDEDT